MFISRPGAFPWVQFAATLFFLIVFPAAKAALVADQVGASTYNGGYGDPVVQSFTPSVDNIAGVDIFISGTGVLTETVSVFLYSDLALTNLLATDTIIDHPRITMAEFRWDAVAIVPETDYYFEIFTGDLAVAALVSNSTDPYDRGDILQAGGNTSFLYKDAVFTTYSDSEFSPVPVPAAVWLFGSALIGLAGFRKKAG